MYDSDRWELLPDGSRRRRLRSTEGDYAVAVAEPEAAPEPDAAEPVSDDPDLEPPTADPQPEPEESEKKATAAAAQLADELGIDLESIEGSGVGGKVTKDDVEKAAQ